MRAVILVENTAPPALEREHGLSVYVEHRGRRVLLDAGHSGKFARNAEKLGVDLFRVDTAVLSHGHYDHADGLDVFFSQVPDIPVRARPGGPVPQYHAERYIGLKGELLERFRGRFLLDDGPLTWGMVCGSSRTGWTMSSLWWRIQNRDWRYLTRAAMPVRVISPKISWPGSRGRRSPPMWAGFTLWGPRGRIAWGPRLASLRIWPAGCWTS